MAGVIETFPFSSCRRFFVIFVSVLLCYLSFFAVFSQASQEGLEAPIDEAGCGQAAVPRLHQPVSYCSQGL